MPIRERFENRKVAGQALGVALKDRLRDPELLILGLPRGGVPVASEVAKILQSPLDVLNVRKLGVPGQPELAMGAIAEDGTEVLNESLIRSLKISDEAIDSTRVREMATLKDRSARFRGNRPALDIAGRTVVVVDDGLATGATMEAAIKLLRVKRALHIVVAVPVGPAGTTARFRKQADDCLCLLEPDDFQAVGQWYERFNQITSDEVCQLLAEATVRH